jgi:hypothetical protein
VLALIGPQPPVSPWWGTLAGVAVAIVPRGGWIASAATAVFWLALAGQPGAALLLALAFAAVPIALPRSPSLWSLPALAPALGVLGLAPAFPALAGQAKNAWRRGALAALGLWWVLLGEALFGRRLLLGVAAGTRDRAAWQGSPADAVGHALAPLLRSGALTLAVVWAVAAVALPVVGRGRSVSFAIFIAGVWALLAAGATAELAHLLRGYPVSFDPLWLLPGAVIAALVAVAGSAARRRKTVATRAFEPD